MGSFGECLCESDERYLGVCLQVVFRNTVRRDSSTLLVYASKLVHVYQDLLEYNPIKYVLKICRRDYSVGEIKKKVSTHA